MEIDQELINEIKNNVRTITGMDESKLSNSLLELYVRSLCTNLLVRTNRVKFLDEMKYLATNLAVDKVNVNSVTGDLQSIQSMSEAGRSVNFGVDSLTQSKINLMVNKQLDENEKLVNKFKLLYRVKNYGES